MGVVRENCQFLYAVNICLFVVSKGFVKFLFVLFLGFTLLYPKLPIFVNFVYTLHHHNSADKDTHSAHFHGGLRRTFPFSYFCENFAKSFFRSQKSLRKIAKIFVFAKVFFCKSFHKNFAFGMQIRI
jgi:hypothetical protein